MPKAKTKRSAAKRYRVTGSGKIVHRKAWGGHLFKSKSRSRQIRLKGNATVSPGDAPTARRLLGR